MKKKKTKLPRYEKLLTYLEKKGKASTADIVRECHILSPTKMISVMRKEGYPIQDVWHIGIDEFGNRVRWKMYYIDESRL